MGLRDQEDGLRIVLKKELVDRISMVLCIHRVYDFKFLGILASPT